MQPSTVLPSTPAQGSDLDSLLTALYVTIDDFLGRPPRLPGRRPQLSDLRTCLPGGSPGALGLLL